MAYDNPFTCTYRFPAVSVVSAATLGRIVGPAGKTGRILDVSYVVTTGVTVAASNLIVGSAADTDAYATVAVPIAAADTGGNGAAKGVTASIPANSVVLVGSAGGATAGAVDALVVINWS
jgi:hypothetical protein